MSRMKNCVVALAGAALSVKAGAAVVLDNFESYSNGQALNNQSGGTSNGISWTGNWVASAGPNITSAALEGSLGVADTGTNINGDSTAKRAFTAQTGTLYASALMSANALTASSFFVFQLSNGSTGNTANTLSFGISNVTVSGTNNTFITRLGTSGQANQNTSTFGAQANQVYQIVAKVSKGNTALRDASNNTLYDQIDLWVNPASEASTVAASTKLTSTNNASLTQLSLLNVRVVNFGTNNGDIVFFDNVNVGTSFAEVVPEPATGGLLGLGAMLFLSRPNRRRK